MPIAHAAQGAVSPSGLTAAGNEIGDQTLGRAVAELRPVGSPDFAAGGHHNGMPGRDIPIVCRGEAWIKVGISLGDAAKFD